MEKQTKVIECTKRDFGESVDISIWVNKFSFYVLKGEALLSEHQINWLNLYFKFDVCGYNTFKFIKQNDFFIISLNDKELMRTPLEKSMERVVEHMLSKNLGRFRTDSAGVMDSGRRLEK